MTEETIDVDGQEFILAKHTSQRGTSDRIRLMKSHQLLDHYASAASRFAEGNMVELGLWDGGSTAYFAALFKPRALVGFELDPSPLVLLDDFVARRGLDRVVHVELGVDQTDTDRIGAVLATHVDGPLDVVVDDASHLLGPTTTTFEYLFPKLTPGGTYFIEDWSNEHFVAEQLRAAIEAQAIDGEALVVSDDVKPEPDPLSRLIIDLVLLAATGNDMIESMGIRRGLVEIRRGPADIAADFTVRGAIGQFGRRVAPRSGEAPQS